MASQGRRAAAQGDRPSRTEEADGHLYVTITNRLLACYRVRNDGKPKCLRRPPVALKKGR